MVKRKTNTAYKPASGCWINLFEPAIGELVGACGYEYAMIDMEHSPVSMDRALTMIRAVQLGGAKALVRTPDSEPHWIGRLMDAGADGAMVPMVNTAELADSISKAAVYAPEGNRGMAAGIVRGSAYGLKSDYVETCRDNFTILLQIETRQAIESSDDILAVEGIDGIFFGPFDLSGSLGHTAQPDHRETRAAIRAVMKKAKSLGLLISTVPSPANNSHKLLKSGFDLVFSGSDVALLRDGMLRDVKQLQKGMIRSGK